VLVVTNMWPTAADPAFGVFVREQVEAVRRQGVRVDVAFVDGRRRAANYLRALPRLRRALAARRYDLVHAHHVLSALAALLAGARRADRPLVVTHHGIEVFEGWQAPLARLVSRRADLALVISPAMAAHLGLPPDAVLPCGVDLALFRPGSKEAARATLGLDPDRPLIAWVGADRPEKRLGLARAAIARLRRDVPEATLLVVAGLPHARVPTYLQAADVLLVTSKREGGPLVVKEALACDRPVISTDVGDVRALISTLPGCAIAGPAPADLAAALRSALACGPVTTRHAVAPFAADRIAAALKDHYLSLSMRARRAPVRLLVLRHGYYPRDPRVRREAAALVARGHAVDVVCLRGAGESAREAVGGVRVLRLPLGHRRAGAARYLFEYGAFFLGAAVAASALHLARRYDVVQVNTMPDALVIAALGPKLAGARVVLDLHEVVPELFAAKFGVPLDHPLPRLLAGVEQAAIRFADACLAVSAPCLDRYAARGAPREKFTIVMNSADPILFPRRPRPGTGDGPAGGPDRIDQPADRPIGRPLGRPIRLISHGTLVERHGFDVLVRAVAELGHVVGHGDLTPGYRLEIVGDGEARPALDRLVDDLGVEDRVTLAGFVPLDDIPARLAAADIGVVANRSDAFTDLVVPTKLMEYVATGVPAVVARTPAVEAYFGDDMVRFFQPGDPADLARAIAALAADPALRDRLAARADEQFSAAYGWPAMAARYSALVERLAGRV